MSDSEKRTQDAARLTKAGRKAARRSQRADKKAERKRAAREERGRRLAAKVCDGFEDRELVRMRVTQPVDRDLVAALGARGWTVERVKAYWIDLADQSYRYDGLAFRRERVDPYLAQERGARIEAQADMLDARAAGDVTRQMRLAAERGDDETLAVLQRAELDQALTAAADDGVAYQRWLKRSAALPVVFRAAGGGGYALFPLEVEHHRLKGFDASGVPGVKRHAYRRARPLDQLTAAERALVEAAQPGALPKAEHPGDAAARRVREKAEAAALLAEETPTAARVKARFEEAREVFRQLPADDVAGYLRAGGRCTLAQFVAQGLTGGVAAPSTLEITRAEEVEGWVYAHVPAGNRRNWTAAYLMGGSMEAIGEAQRPSVTRVAVYKQVRKAYRDIADALGGKAAPAQTGLGL
jgi:hypothetical protein